MALRHTAEVSYYIHANYRRQGIASTLLRHALQLCPTLQIKSLLAILMEPNSASIQLLQKHGFSQWGRLPNVAEFDTLEVSQVVYGMRVCAWCI